MYVQCMFNIKVVPKAIVLVVLAISHELINHNVFVLFSIPQAVFMLLYKFGILGDNLLEGR